VNTASADTVAGRKYYQPHQDVHYEVQMRVVCAPEGQGDARTSAFASALQDRYVIKKVNNSASLGVGGLGSVSLPVSATDDTLVKVGSETITDAQFYARFFQLFERYVRLAPPGTEPALMHPASTPARRRRCWRQPRPPPPVWCNRQPVPSRCRCKSPRPSSVPQPRRCRRMRSCRPLRPSGSSNFSQVLPCPPYPVARPCAPVHWRCCRCLPPPPAPRARPPSWR